MNMVSITAINMVSYFEQILWIRTQEIKKKKKERA